MGFTYPGRLAISHDINYQRRSGKLEARFLAVEGMTDEDARHLAARFSLSTVRATAAVVSYINKPDVQKLSEVLGHKKLDMRLLRRYLPAPLLKFFEERWMRLFQCGILVEALKGSKHLLPAVGFSTLHELNEFLSHHALKWANRHGAVNDTNTKHLFDSVVLAVNEDILTVLASLQLAVTTSERPVTKLARMYSDYAGRLFSYIENSIPPRDDFKSMLVSAKSNARVDLIARGAIDD
jgi:hypothetical protein